MFGSHPPSPIILFDFLWGTRVFVFGVYSGQNSTSGVLPEKILTLFFETVSLSLTHEDQQLDYGGWLVSPGALLSANPHSALGLDAQTNMCSFYCWRSIINVKLVWQTVQQLSYFPALYFKIFTKIIAIEGI